MSKTEGNSAPFSYDGLDRVIHEKARLGLMTSLMAHPKGLAFADLKQLCGLTDGNLSRHLGGLQEAALVEVTKGYEGKRPHTSCRLTKIGRSRSPRRAAAWQARLVYQQAPHPPRLNSVLPFFDRRLCNAKWSPLQTPTQ